MKSYISFLGGGGEMEIDEDRFAVSEGSVVKVAPDAERAWWNTGNEDFYYVGIQASSNRLKTAGINDAELGKAKVPWL